MKWGVLVFSYQTEELMGWLKDVRKNWLGEDENAKPTRLVLDTRTSALTSAELAEFALGATFKIKPIKEYIMAGKKVLQCPAIFRGSKRSNGTTYVFCTRHEGHKGDHRGSGKQWNRKGEKVKITLPQDVK